MKQHRGMLAHDGFATHSHEVRPDHAGVQAQWPPEKPPQISDAQWLELYAWLEEKILTKHSSANDIETPDYITLSLSSQVEVLQEVRERMRSIASTLPRSEADEL